MSVAVMTVYYTTLEIDIKFAHEKRAALIISAYTNVIYIDNNPIKSTLNMFLGLTMNVVESCNLKQVPSDGTGGHSILHEQDGINIVCSGPFIRII